MAQIIWSDKAWQEYRSCLLYAKGEFGAKTAKRFFEKHNSINLKQIEYEEDAL